MDVKRSHQTISSNYSNWFGDVGVDNVYGWGYLNLEKALKGPAVFDKRLTFDNDGNRIDNVIIDMNGYPTSSENIANYTFAMIYQEMQV